MLDSPRRSPRLIVLLALALASLLKIGWAIYSRGTCDAMFFYLFAQKLQVHPIDYLYEHVELFNHMPLAGWTVQALYAAVGGGYEMFALALRLASMLADIALVVALLHWREQLGGTAWWALALFALSPVSIMVSGFHGNIDPIMTAFVFGAAVAAWKERMVWCAILFALSCNVKIVPIMLSPAFFFYWTARGARPATTFFVIVTVIMLLGTAWPLVKCPVDFYHHVLSYGSTWGTWGLTYLLKIFGPEALQKVDYKDLNPLQNQIMSVLKLVIIAFAMSIGWLRRRATGPGIFITILCVYAVMFVFAPGLGVQYMVWAAPFLLLYSPGWYAAITAGSTVYLAAFYSTSSNTEFPWDSVWPKGPEIAIWGPFSLPAWLTFIALLVWLWRQRILFPPRRLEAQ